MSCSRRLTCCRGRCLAARVCGREGEESAGRHNLLGSIVETHRPTPAYTNTLAAAITTCAKTKQTSIETIFSSSASSYPHPQLFRQPLRHDSRQPATRLLRSKYGDKHTKSVNLVMLTYAIYIYTTLLLFSVYLQPRQYVVPFCIAGRCHLQ